MLKQLEPIYNYVTSGKFGPTEFMGSYNDRNVRGSSTKKSEHAYGNAFDVGGSPKTMYDISRYLQTQPGVRNVIYNGQIWSSSTGTWKKYNGVNPHTDHVHVDFEKDYKGPGNTSSSSQPVSRVSNTPNQQSSSNTYKIGSSGDVVEQIQKKVGTYADGQYGKNTANAVKAFQRKKGLKVDGVAGPETLNAMGIKVSATPDSNSLAVMNRNNAQPKSNGNYTSSYTNTYKTKNDALKSSGYKTYKSQLSQAVQAGAVPMNAVQALTELIGRESTWNSGADNPSSTAYGYGQFLDSTRANYKKKLPQYNYDNPVHQIILTYNYAIDRYGSVEKALQHWDKNKWY